MSPNQPLVRAPQGKLFVANLNNSLTGLPLGFPLKMKLDEFRH